MSIIIKNMSGHIQYEMTFMSYGNGEVTEKNEQIINQDNKKY